jgi:tRNA-modifying protein YgfZ
LSQHLTTGTVLRLDGKPAIHLLDVDAREADVIALAVIDDDAAEALKNSASREVDDGTSVRITHSWSA